MARKFFLLALLVAALAFYVFYDSHDYASLLAGKRVIVCGASTGIGEQIAYIYAKYGAKIVITARREAVLKEVAAKCRDFGAASVEAVPLDLAEAKSAQILFERAQSFMGGVDILVLNHIVGYYGPWGPKSVDKLDLADKILRVNTWSYISLATHALEALEASRGNIIVVSSFAGKMGAPFTAPYSASKHALHGFFDSLRQDLIFANSNISVTICVLGFIDTESALGRTRGVILVPTEQANSTAEAIVKGGARSEREIFYPRSLALSLYIRPFFPRLLDTIVRIFHNPSEFYST